MRWNCPHCGAQLTLDDQKLDQQWSFARCYRCDGTSMLRAPAGEIALLSKSAQANFNRITHGPKPAIRVAPSRHPPSNPLPPTSSEYLPALPLARSKMGILPLIIGMTAALAITSGIYLLLESQSLHSAPDQAALGTIDADRTPADSPEVVKAPPLVPQTRIAKVDRIQESAMAPLRSERDLDKTDDFAVTPGLEVRVIGERANIHAGPGVGFPVVANALPNQSYRVTSWDGRWFKVAVEDQGRKLEGWLRNDLVQVNSLGR